MRKAGWLLTAIVTATAIAAPSHGADPSTGPALAWVTASSPAQTGQLDGFDLAEVRRGDEVAVVLWPGDRERLRSRGLSYRVEIHDLMSEARRRGLGAWKLEAAGERTTYRRLADHEADLAKLAQDHPDRARLFVAPLESLEGRPVYGLEIGTDPGLRDGRATAFVMGLHHAREWPTAEVATDLAMELVTSDDPRIAAIRSSTRVLVVPVVNPDGFTHSRDALVHEGIDQFLGLPLGIAGQATYWRKNRRGVRSFTGRHLTAGSYGVDPNRNYGFQWGGGTWTGGPASRNPADQTYQGRAPFSEPEAQNVRAIALANNVTAMLTLHTYGDLILWPWGHTGTRAPDHAALSELGHSMGRTSGASAMQGIGLYPTTGTTDDWYYAAAGAFGYTFELGSAFHPPHSSIRPMYNRFRDAMLQLIEAASVPAYHSILSGTVRDEDGAPVPAVLRLTKTGETPAWQDGNGDAPKGLLSSTDVIDISMQTSEDGTFTWHVNPSRRPIASGPEAYELTVSAPGYADLRLSVSVERGQTLELGTITLTPQ